MASHNILRVMSYNSRGMNVVKIEYLKSLLSTCDLLFLQEHWFCDAQVQSLSSINSDFLSCGVCGFDSQTVLQGRPFGGCAILWRKELHADIRMIDTGSRRVCAISCTSESYKLLFINVYMPFEDGDVNVDEFCFQLSVIENILEANADYLVICGGDFNVDFARDWVHTRLLNSFCDRVSLRPASEHGCSTVDYTYNFNMHRFQAVDHFLLSEQFFPSAVTKFDVLHDVCNCSDHDPILLHLDVAIARSNCAQQHFRSKPAWNRANETQIMEYSNNLRYQLSNVSLPLSALLCHDVNCCNVSHMVEINKYVEEISASCLSAASQTIPLTTNRQSGRVPGWSEYVEPFKKKSHFWHLLWVQCGRPRVGVVFDIMRKTRAEYHRAVRHVKKGENDIINDRFAAGLIGDRNRDFWSEAKRIRRNKACFSNCVDSKSAPADIANIFANKYKELYSSVAYNVDDMADLKSLVADKVSNAGFDAQCRVSYEEVVFAVCKLKAGKGDGDIGLSSDYFLHACNELHVHISLLFSSLLVHGVSPDRCNLSTVVPIPKGKNVCLSDSANYRGIALSSILGKLLDLVVLDRFHDYLCLSDLQFGFRSRRSTDQCTMVLKETISYYVNNGSAVFTVFLDATKAFDRIEYCKLFHVLLSRKLPPVFIRLLLNMYTGHVTRVLWNGIASDRFSVSNGVKQGGVLSPVLFCLYMDGLLDRLSHSKIGCIFGNVYAGALAYADDIVLLAPTASAMRSLLKICEDYAREYSVIFNAKKSACIYSSPCKRRSPVNSCLPTFHVGGQPVEYVNEWSHLGHIISANCDDKSDIISRRNTLCGQINNVLCYFGKCQSLVRQKLMFAYCYSLYGSVLWDLNSHHIESLCTTWRKGLRRALNLPANTHCALLPVLSNSLPVIDELAKRSVSFIQRCLSSDSHLVRFISYYGMYVGRMFSPIGRNVFLCCSRFRVSIDDIPTLPVSHIYRHWRNSLNSELVTTTQVLLELISVRDGAFCMPEFDSMSVRQFIECICTN